MASSTWWVPAGPVRTALEGYLHDDPAISVREVASRAHVDKRTISKLLSGQTKLVGLGTAESILIAIDCDELIDRMEPLVAA